MAKYQYKTISLMTLPGIKAAEKLHQSEAWKVIYHTFASIMFERKV